MTVLLRKETVEQAIHRIAAGLEGEIRDAFLTTVTSLKRRLSVNAMTELLETGDITGALRHVGGLEITAADLRPITDAIATVTTQAAQATAAEFGLAFNVVNERAVRFATEQGGRLITQVSSNTVEAVQNIVAQGLREGIAPRQQAQLIKEIVGLTQRDALAVDRFLKGAIDSGMNRTQARRQAERMSARLLKRRAENIARTETMTAANMGTQLGWEAAQDGGLLPPGTEKVWIATEDIRLCPICAALDGQVVDMGQGNFDATQEATSFDTKDGVVTVADTRPRKPPRNPNVSYTPRTPPAHASCRCTMGIA